MQRNTERTLFQFIHDETRPVGLLGRGTHYSVARVAEWRDVRLRNTAAARLHDFAIIWDEDHDERVIPVLESLYLNGLLAPVLYAGERKGTLSLILDPAMKEAGPSALGEYEENARNLAAPDGDAWTVEVALMGDGSTRIIADGDERVDTYLRNIHVLWSLGLKDPAVLGPAATPS